ncbi:hypothetical protein IFM89_024378, partial [Coptis chinensis]
QNYDVSCNCTHSFCWNCTEDAHSPVDCDTVEFYLERLHQCAKKELPFYLHGYDPPGYFNEFRTKLCELTSMTRNYFKNLVQALEWPG